MLHVDSCARSFSKQLISFGPSSLLLFQSPASCLIRLSLSPQLPISLHIPFQNDLSANCDQPSLLRLLDSFCSTPSCTSQNATLLPLCSLLQPLHCDPQNRFQPKSKTPPPTLFCQREPGLPTEELPTEELPTEELPTEELPTEKGPTEERPTEKLPTEELPTEEVPTKAVPTEEVPTKAVPTEAAEEEESLSSEVPVEALVACGGRSFGDFALFSGGLQDLGNYDACLQASPKATYCTITYYDFVRTGRCVASECTQAKMDQLLNFVCQPEVSCLDYLNVIPLDLCFMTKFLGCGRALSIANLLDGTDEDFIATIFPPSEQPATPRLLLPEQEFTPDQINALVAKTQLAINRNSNLLHYALRFTVPKLALANYTLPQQPSSSLAQQPSSSLAQQPSPSLAQQPSPSLPSFRTTFEFQMSKSQHKLDWALAMFLICAFGLLLPVVGGTAGAKLRAFNLKANFRKMMHMEQKLRTGSLGHVCGMRTLSMIWIIVGHTFCFSIFSGAASKTLPTAITMLNTKSFQAVLAGQLAVDSFFFFSGYFHRLTTAPLLWQLTPLTATPKVILRRYWRLVGPLALVMALSYFGLPFLFSGPQWPPFVQMLRTGRRGGCRRYWWRNILFVNNLSFGEDEILISECFGHSWYLACDFQFFLYGTLLLHLARWSRKLYLWATAVSVCVALAASAWTVRKYDLHTQAISMSLGVASFGQRSLVETSMTNWQKYYIKPWTRIPPYLIGLIFAEAQQSGWVSKWLRGEDGKIDKSVLLLGHSVAASLMVALIWVFNYEANRSDGLPWHPFLDTVYMITHSLFWALCVGWFVVTLIYASPQRKEGLLTLKDEWFTSTARTLFSHPLLTLLSLATYCTYLVHTQLQWAYYATQRQIIEMSQGIGYLESVSHCIVAFGVGLLLHLFVELPLGELF